MSFFQSLFRPRHHKPTITPYSLLYDAERAFPGFAEFCTRKFKVVFEGQITLMEFCNKHRLPSPLILIAEFQVSGKVGKIHFRTAYQISNEINQFEVLDVRESWESQHGSLPGSRPLTKVLLNEIISQWPKQAPILLYCHYGVRSLDAAAMLIDEGFTEVFVLEGGIDAWAQIDASVKRYEHAWC